MYAVADIFRTFKGEQSPRTLFLFFLNLNEFAQRTQGNS